MNKLFFPLTFAMIVIWTGIFSNGLPEIKITNTRHSYYRNEQVTFETVVKNPGNSVINVGLSVELSPLTAFNKSLVLKGGESVTIPYKLRCSSLKPGHYNLQVTVSGQGTNEVRMFDVYISQQPNPQRLSVDYWVPLNYWVPDPQDRLAGSLRLFEWGLAHGFNTFKVDYTVSGPAEDHETATEQMKFLFEKAIRERVNLGLKIGTTSSSYFNGHPEVFVRPRGVANATILDNQKENELCLREPVVIANAENMIRSQMQTFGAYPSFYQILINSEFRSGLCYSDDCINRLKAETGLDLYNYDINPLRPPKTEEEARKAGLPEELVSAVPEKGIIENNNPYYMFYMWWWKRGMGDALLNERISDIVKEYKNDAITWHDPFRLAPVYGRHKGLDCIGHWNYTHPDPKYTSYIESLITAAKPENQLVMPDMTTWIYQNWIAPSDSGVLLIPPDILRENLWIALSRSPDIISHYNSTTMNPLRDVDPWHRDPETFEMMKWMSDNIYKPYGPFIRQLDRTSRKAAILSSASSVLYPEISRGGYVNTAIYPFYSLLIMAHIPTDVIFDETISRYGLDGYDILFLHQCETLTRDVYEKILDFEKRGGIVIGDMHLRADIPLDYRVSFDLDHRKRQLADLILKGEGVTADEDRELMIRYSNELRDFLGNKVERLVDSDSREVIFNVLESGPVKYIFIINDKRTYGEKYGMKWKTFHEKGVEQTVRVIVKSDATDPVLYDIRTSSILPAVSRGGICTFDVKLAPGDGTVIAVYPKPIKKIDIRTPEVILRDDYGIINISLVDSDGKKYGSQPVRIIITDPAGEENDLSDYYATENGTFCLEFIPAVNDLTGKWTISVTDLTSGIEGNSEFTVR